MPLLKRKPFSPEKPPPDLKPDEEIFVCRQTNEIFRNYESFFKRTILCNSLVWSCKYTGKSSLTYSEAVESEDELLKLGRTLPEPIQQAALTLVHHTQRGRLANLCDEVYNYIKDRYQEGEEVDILCSGKKRQGVIIDVIPPEDNSVRLVSSVSPPKKRKLSSTKSDGELGSPTSNKSAGTSKTPTKSRTPSTDNKPKTPKSRKSSVSDTKDKVTPSKTHRRSTSEDGKTQTSSKPKKHSIQDGSPGNSRNYNGKAVASTSKAHKEGVRDRSPTPKIKSKSSDDKLVVINDDKALRSPKLNRSNNGPEVVVIKDDQSSQDERSQTLTSPKMKTKSLWPLATQYKYEVKLYPELGTKKKEKAEVVIVSAYQVGRSKGTFNREKLKVFLKISCIRSTPQSDDGFYVVKKNYCVKFDLGEPVPVQLKSPPKQKKERASKRKSSQRTGEEAGAVGSVKKKKRKLTGGDKGVGTNTKEKKESKLKKLTPEERQRIIEEEKEKRKKNLEEEKEKRKVEKEREKNELRAKREEERVKKKVERDRERERLKEQKRLEALVFREWNKPREDLQLDDLKELPTSVPLNMKIPQDMFGDVVMVLEFLNIFGSIFDLKDEFPSGLTFALLEEALTEHDAEGVYYDLMQFLLGAILRTHLEEEEDEGLDTMHVKNPQQIDLDDDDDNSMATVSAAASIAAAWPLVYQGKALHELIMDPFTCSELLRLHLLSSGARIGCRRDVSYRWQRRGGFTYSDDAVVEFRHREPSILKALVNSNVYDLVAHDKLKILVALCTQMMTYAIARDHIEDGFEKCKKARREWQEGQWADVRREKEEAAARYRRKQEDRLRQKEEMERRKKKDKEGEGAKADAETSSKPKSQAGVEPSTEGDQNTSDEKKNKKKSRGRAKDDDAGKESGNDACATTSKQANEEVRAQKSSDETKEEELARLKEEEEELARQRKEERKRRDHEFILELSKATAMSSLQSLGRDRMFRRYWSFRSLRGVFIEDDDPELQKCLLQESDEDDEESEDDETEEVDGTKSAQVADKTSKTSEGETSNSVENSKSNPQGGVKGNGALSRVVNGESESKSEKEDAIEPQRSETPISSEKKSMRRSSIAKDLREIYKDRQVVRWSLFSSKEQLDSLLDSLNQRGVRERVLRENIQQDYNNLVKAINKCPFTENPVQKKEVKQRGRRSARHQQQQSVDKSRYKVMGEFIEANLRDQVLDLDDRVWQGGLGMPKVDDRLAWRKEIEHGIYDHFREKSTDAGAVKNDQDGEGVIVNGDASAEKMEDGSSGEQAATESRSQDDSDQPVVNGDVQRMDVDDSDTVCEELGKLVERPTDLPLSSVPAHLHPGNSGTSSPVSESRSGTPSKTVNAVIKEVALALLKVEQGIERKYLNPPLGEDEETKKQKQREAAATALKEFNEMMKRADDAKRKARKERRNKFGGASSQKDEHENKDESENGQQKPDNDDASSSSSEEPAKARNTCLERWEESLMACTNLSQVFVHLNTLDQSIAWSKSVLNARCRLCRRKGDAEHMLLCDACDRGHHMYCLKPPIKQIPEGNWFCADCRPKEPRRSDRRRKPVISEDEEEDQEEDAEDITQEEKENSDDNEEEEQSDYESEDGEEEDQESVEEEEEADCAASEHGDSCALCGEAGELLCCDTCPLAYHLSCTYPLLRRVPRGNWACQVCTGADEDRTRKDRVKKGIIEAAQKTLRKSAKAAHGGRSSRATTRANSRQDKGGSRSSRKRRVSPSPSPPPRARRAQRRASADSGTKSKRRRVRVESGC